MRIIADQYTRGLIGSPHRVVVLTLLKKASRSDDPTGAVAQAHHEMRARGERWLDELDRVGDLRSHPGYRNKVAVAGPGNGGCCAPGPNTSPACTRDGRRLCDYDPVGVRTASFTGAAAFTLSPQPGASFTTWRPKLARAYAFDRDDPSVPRWEGLFITLIQVGQHPVVGFSNAPAAGVLDGQAFADYVTPDPPGIPVGWPDFTTTPLQRALVISGWSLWAGGISSIAELTVYGNGIDPSGCEKRCNPDNTPIPPMGGNGNFTAGGNGNGGRSVA